MMVLIPLKRGRSAERSPEEVKEMSAAPKRRQGESRIRGSQNSSAFPKVWIGNKYLDMYRSTEAGKVERSPVYRVRVGQEVQPKNEAP